MTLELGVLHMQSTLEGTERIVLEKVPISYRYAWLCIEARDSTLDWALTKEL